MSKPLIIKMIEKELNKRGNNVEFVPFTTSVSEEKKLSADIDAQLRANDAMRSKSVINAGKNICL